MHDRNGTPLKEGDVVALKGKITSAYACEDYGKVTVEVGYEAEHGPKNVRGSITLNSQQALRLEKSPVE